MNNTSIRPKNVTEGEKFEVYLKLILFVRFELPCLKNKYLFYFYSTKDNWQGTKDPFNLNYDLTA